MIFWWKEGKRAANMFQQRRHFGGEEKLCHDEEVNLRR
jgi:hypothetical protein